MGLPLSPLIAEIFMSKVEDKIISISKLESKVIKRLNYVNNVQVIWTGTDRLLDSFLEEINKTHPKNKIYNGKGTEQLYKLFRSKTHKRNGNKIDIEETFTY